MVSGCLRTLIVILLLAIAGLVLFLLQPPLDVIWSVPSEFIFLVIGGILLFGLISAFIARLDGWVGAAARPNQPQVIRLETRETPAAIVWAAIGATFRLFIVFAVLLVIAVVLMSFVGVVFIGATPLEFIRSLIDYLRSMF